MTNPSFFNQILIWPILNILMAFYKAFSILRTPGAFGLAIIFLTLFIRGLLYPLTRTQLASAKKMAELKPELDGLTKKHKGDRQRLQQAQLELYKKHGLNPAAGCLPLLLQMPVFIALYQVFWQILGNGNLGQVIKDINKIVYHPWLKIVSLDLSFFGLNLAEKPSNWQKAGWWLLTIPLITAGLQWWQTQLISGQQTVVSQEKQNSPSLNLPVRQAGFRRAKKGKEAQKDLGSEMQKQMALIAPLMIGFVSFSFPVGLALYWNIFTLFGIIQSLKIHDR